MENELKSSTYGAWLISHTKKLQDISNVSDFEDIELAGKCGIFLSNLAASDEHSDINSELVNSIAKVSQIKKTELDTIKKKLKESELIDVAENGSISVIGVTTSSILTHTSNIFTQLNPSNYQKAAITLSEKVSDLPSDGGILSEYISDTYKLTKTQSLNLLDDSEQVGFVDAEKLDNDDKCYFNGNLFKRKGITKTNIILSALSQEDSMKINTFNQTLSEHGCVAEISAIQILGEQLLYKLQSIGMYDFNEVVNERERKMFITKPGAFSKFGDPFEEDVLDLAKAFVSSLFYGIHNSTTNRGKITMLKALLNKLIRGEEVGPATAIGQDYKILELKRVIQLRREGNTNRYYMRLLKRDIGEIAIKVLESGDASNQGVITDLTATSISDYQGPEQNRIKCRKKQDIKTKNDISELLRTFRQ